MTPMPSPGPLELAEEHDAAGREDLAIPLYQAALAEPLPDERRVQVLLQLGSSLRNVGRVTEALAVLGEAAGLAPESVAPPAFRALVLVGIVRRRGQSASCSR